MKGALVSDLHGNLSQYLNVTSDLHVTLTQIPHLVSDMCGHLTQNLLLGFQFSSLLLKDI